MTHNDGPERMSSIMLASLGAVVFVALVITGGAIASVVGETDVIVEDGASPNIAIIGIGLTTLVFAVMTKRGIDRRSSVGMALLIALSTAATYVAGFFIASVLHGISGFAVVSHLLFAGFVVVIALAAAAVAASVFAVSRHEGGTPQWKWEHEEDDDEQ